MKRNQTGAGRIGQSGYFVLYGLMKAGPLHGWGIRQAVRDITEGQIELPIATLYSALGRLMELGLVEIVREEKSDEGPDRKVYRVTGEGARVATAELDAAASVLRQLRPKLGV